MPDKSINGVPIEAILNPQEDKPEDVQWIAKLIPHELTIVEPDVRWPDAFQTFKSRILAAFEQGGEDNATKVDILAIDHVGSTSVPALPAKAVIDIDLVLSSNTLSAESFYVPRLEAAGFRFLLREPPWHEHRLFRAWEPMSCNLHVWGPRSPEVERHRIFRDWLREHKDDRELYARTKRECAALSREKGESIDGYNNRKQEVITEIYTRAFTELGYLS